MTRTVSSTFAITIALLLCSALIHAAGQDAGRKTTEPNGKTPAKRPSLPSGEAQKKEVEIEPSDRAESARLAQSLRDQARAKLRAGDLSGANELFTRAARIFTALVTEAPEVATHWNVLVEVLFEKRRNLITLVQVRDRETRLLDELDAVSDEWIAMTRKRATKFGEPKHRDSYAFSLAGEARRLTDGRTRRGKRTTVQSTAEAYLKEAIQIERRLVEAFPMDAKFANQLADFLELQKQRFGGSGQ